MNPSDSLHLDEHLARLLAAYDQGIENADGHAATIDVPSFHHDLNSNEHRVEPLSGGGGNQGSISDLLPDASRGDPYRAPAAVPMPETHRVGRFELRRQLGRGGCGIVFLAYDPKLKREVALKIPRPELLMSADARKRLLREATAAAAFDHPNLVPVYETGEIGPVCFIATVFCPGQTLAEWLDRQAFPVPIRQAARLVAQLAEAVQHAHDRGVLHRDLKPNNVILQDAKADVNSPEAPPGACPLRGDYFTPRIVDFGLAKLADQGPGETATRQVLGTPKYMAPEQAQARHEDVGPEADVYALGGILYELLTGRAPYEGPTDVEVLRQCIEGNLTPPGKLRKDIPRDLEAICLKSMSRSPARRYRTAIDFADDLRRFLDGLPTLARPLNALGRASRTLRRNDQLFALITVTTIAFLLLAAGFWSAYQSRKFQVVQNESQLREAERTRLENSRSYVRHVGDAFHLWETGNFELMDTSLRNARLACGANGYPPEFAWGYGAQLARLKHNPIPCPPDQPVAIASSGPFFAVGHRDGSISVWKSQTMQPAGLVKAHEKSISRLLFREPRRLVSFGGGIAREWAMSANGELHALPDMSPLAPSASASHLALAPDSKTTATTNLEGAVRLGGETITASARATALEFIPSPIHKWLLAVGTADGVIQLFDQQHREVRTLAGTGDAILGLATSPDGDSLYAIAGSCVCEWNVPSGKLQVRHGFGRDLRGISFLDGSRTLALVSNDGLRVVDLAADTGGPALRSLASPVVAAATRSDGSEVGAAYADGSVEVSSRQSLSPRRFAAQGRSPLAALRFTENGPLVGIESTGREVALWEFGEKVKLQFRAETRAAVVDYSPATGWLAAGDDRGRVTVWSPGTREVVGTFDTKSGGAVRFISFSNNGRWLAVPMEENSIAVWLIGEAAHSFHMPGYDGNGVLRFLGDDMIATSGPDGLIRVWSLLTRREEHTLIGHLGRVTSLAATPDVRTLASGAANGEVKLWDLTSGLELFGLKRHNGPVLAAEFSADGRLLLTGGRAPGGRGELVYWDALKE